MAARPYFGLPVSSDIFKHFDVSYPPFFVSYDDMDGFMMWRHTQDYWNGALDNNATNFNSVITQPLNIPDQMQYSDPLPPTVNPDRFRIGNVISLDSLDIILSCRVPRFTVSEIALNHVLHLDTFDVTGTSVLPETKLDGHTSTDPYVLTTFLPDVGLHVRHPPKKARTTLFGGIDVPSSQIIGDGTQTLAGGTGGPLTFSLNQFNHKRSFSEAGFEYETSDLDSDIKGSLSTQIPSINGTVDLTVPQTTSDITLTVPELNATFHPSTDAPSTVESQLNQVSLRCILVLDKQPNGNFAGLGPFLAVQAKPDVNSTDVLSPTFLSTEHGPYTVNPTSFYNLRNRDRFDILWDESYDLNSTGQANLTIRKSVPLRGLQTVFEPISIDPPSSLYPKFQISTNQLFFLFISDGLWTPDFDSRPLVHCTTRLYFSDR